MIVRTVYRVHVTGLENLPEGGCLLLPNHVTWVDAVVLQAACPRPIRFIVYEPIYRNPVLNPIFRLLKAIPITTRKAKDAVREATELIKAGEIVCIFPEGELSRSGILLRLRRGYELIARSASAPVVPVWLDQLWGSIFSFQGGRYFKKLPKRFPYPVTVLFGKALPAEKADIGAVRQQMLELGEIAFQQRPLLQGHLGMACLRGLKHSQFETALFDGMDGSTITRGTLLAAGIVFANYLKEHCPKERIAVVLPPGRAAVIANLAVMLANKVPVNLNFTAGRASLEAAIRIGDLHDVITAGPLLTKFADFPWPDNVLRVEEILPPLKKKIGIWRAIVAVTPWWILAPALGIPSKGGHKEAVVLFTSGSSGEPKGVVLSHHNLLANTSQFGEMLNLTRDDGILASLPFFHSFGCTVTLWYPLIEGVRMVTYPNPLDAEKIASLVHEHKITLLLATPTFLRAYIRKATKEQLASIELTVTGAEKLPRDIATAFYEKFGKKVFEGYGLTETAPVASVNLPEPPKFKEDDEVQPSSRDGSTGKLAPGIAAQIRDPETGVLMSLHETGMLWLKGANIFEGYLNDPKRTAEVIQDGWFKTGDLARFDEDGFLFIEGRVSRFSKIGGEMVPHETLEGKIREALGSGPDDERWFCIVGVPDSAKGEAIVLLASKEVDLPALRSKLLAVGVPALWIPKTVKSVEKIPLLGSGKLDLRACKDLAMAEKAAAVS
jgi:acyl-[acyl-carrier-protein]-phospholipid O-acyltransferase/long-chain-fatty-acid--[acyl-carrier-protein] ligase